MITYRKFWTETIYSDCHSGKSSGDQGWKGNTGGFGIIDRKCREGEGCDDQVDLAGINIISYQ